VTRVLPAARLAVRQLVLVVALLAGVLCLLGAVSLDVARAAGAAAVRDAGDRSPGTGPQAGSGRGTAESGPHAGRALLRAALTGPAPAVGADPEAAPGRSAAAVPAPLSGARGTTAAPVGPVGSSVDGPRDRAPPRTAGT